MKLDWKVKPVADKKSVTVDVEIKKKGIRVVVNGIKTLISPEDLATEGWLNPSQMTAEGLLEAGLVRENEVLDYTESQMHVPAFAARMRQIAEGRSKS